MALPKTDQFVLDAMRKFAEAKTLGEQQEAVVVIADAIDGLVMACEEAREKITGIEDIFDGLAQMLDLAIAKVESK